MKIIIDRDIPFIQGRITERVETIYENGADITPEMANDADALVVRTRTRCNENLLKDSNIRLIVSATIGTDHIDLPWCVKKGIEVRNAPGCNAPGVAQYVFASLFRSGFDPTFHTLGIIGYGNVGKTVGEWAKEMGIKILVSDPPRKETGHKDVEYLPLEEVLEKSDAISFHVPLTKDGRHPTYHLLNKDNIKFIRKGGIVINSSRGGVVEEKSLIQYLRNGELKAIVDVWENEPEINMELLNLATIATPHIAGYSREGKIRGTRMALEALNDTLDIKADLKGLELQPDRNLKISKKLIENSYDPTVDSYALKNAPYHFEILRNNYNYRHEPLFSILNKLSEDNHKKES